MNQLEPWQRPLISSRFEGKKEQDRVKQAIILVWEAHLKCTEFRHFFNILFAIVKCIYTRQILDVFKVKGWEGFINYMNSFKSNVNGVFMLN